MKFKFLNLANLLILITFLVTWYITAIVISPYLHYSFQQIAFITGTEFLKGFFSYPGGFADYISCFISQFFYFNTVGSFLIVAVAALQGFIALNILKRLAGELKFRYSVIAAILLFGVLVMCDYRYPYYASVRLLFGYLFIWGFQLVSSKSPKLSAFLWPFMAGLLFYLAGGAALLVFGLSTALIFAITNKQRVWYLVIPGFLLIAGLMPYLSYKFIFPLTLRNIYGITIAKPPAQLAYTPEYPLYIYYALLPAFLLLALFFILIRKPKLSSEPSGTLLSKGEVATKIRFYNRTPFLVSIQVLVFGLMGFFLISKWHDSFKKKVLTIEYLANNEQWSDLLKNAKSVGKYDFRVNFHVNRAYSHLGQLPDRLFEYPQLLGIYGLFVDPSAMVGSTHMPTSDLYYDLGFMNESQHWAFEAETLFPNSPRILKRLVMINLVNRKYYLAGEFLNVLKKNMLYQDWVGKYEKYVSDTTLAASDKEIAEKRRFTPKMARVNVGTLEGLKLLFETNQDNRMAYDYLLTYFILDLQLPEFVDYLRYYTHYNLKRIPRAWEEALSTYILRNKAFPDFITPETISKDCLQRIMSFNKVVKGYRNNLQEAKSTLSQNYSETYWYYLFYLNPKVTNVLDSKTNVE
jgi:hypothetical protein